MIQGVPSLVKSPILLVGPAFSGKTDLAPRYLRPDQTAMVLGTALAVDSISQRRIAGLKALRPAAWESIDVGHDLLTALDALPANVNQVLIDSTSQWLANLLVQGELSEGEEETRLELGLSRIEEVVRWFQQTTKRVVIVSGEIGAGPAPSRPLERLFRQLVGNANQRFASLAGTVVAVTAGIPYTIKAMV